MQMHRLSFFQGRLVRQQIYTQSCTMTSECLEYGARMVEPRACPVSTKVRQPQRIGSTADRLRSPSNQFNGRSLAFIAVHSKVVHERAVEGLARMSDSDLESIPS